MTRGREARLQVAAAALVVLVAGGVAGCSDRRGRSREDAKSSSTAAAGATELPLGGGASPDGAGAAGDGSGPGSGGGAQPGATAQPGGAGGGAAGGGTSGGTGGEPVPGAAPGDPRSQPVSNCTDRTSQRAAELVLLDKRYEPTCVKVHIKQPLAVANKGRLTHNISIQGAMDVDIDAGQETVTDPVEAFVPKGTYTFQCKFHRIDGMQGQLQVVD
ncbi:MAG TPA: hypothetical protein VNE62_03845 [Actinomycetota bacterium]|nr:hypothetical protein [Actinomycetota bacterium]